ncbi:hypothetical protein A5733_04365 [Mycobacterium sp. NS-7484]|uniref:hypothetical protein n=1 Tax=Mycobacterium sp. NS-7484 TaxID=1834161 RepID=UPI00096D0B68|nr:hypothetical protein [Mycobacterium sp. NS-7484]OMC00351.1 hypothetical protein A5733_04365 [Mycobacterium sp. NS-7484]
MPPSPNHNTIAVGALLAAFALTTACSSNDTSNGDSLSTTVAATVPAYEMTEQDKELTALVKTDNTDQLRLVYREIADQVTDTYPEGGYFLRIDCAFGNEPGKTAIRLANARIAVGQLGAAQTGLKAGQSDIKFNTGVRCIENPEPETFDPNRPLDQTYAVELCEGRLEEKYVAGQLPLTLSNVRATEDSGEWTVSGSVRGTVPEGQSSSDVSFECVVTDNPLRSSVTKFDH